MVSQWVMKSGSGITILLRLNILETLLMRYSIIHYIRSQANKNIEKIRVLNWLFSVKTGVLNFEMCRNRLRKRG